MPTPKPTPKPMLLVPAGTHTSSKGKKITLTPEDLREAASSYDPKLHESPIVVGHPKDNGPAFGWYRRLFEKDGDLYGEPIQVAPEFIEWAKAGRIKKRSASLYPPNDPSNPTPGKWYLRHVGFLGAQPPAIKGMPDYEFTADDDAIDLEFQESADFAEGFLTRVLRNLRDWFLEHHDRETADQVIPPWMLESDGTSVVTEDLKRQIAEAGDDTQTQPAFSEPETQPMNTLGRLLNRKIDSQDAQRGEVVSRLADSAKTTVDRVNKIVSGAVALPTNAELASFAEVLDCEADELKAALPEDFQEARREFDRREADLARRERAAKDAELKRRRKEVTEFCEQLAERGQILPRHVAPIAEVMVSLGETEVEFAEGDGDDADTVKKEGGEILREFLEALPKQIDFKEKSAKDEDELAHVDFVAPQGTTVDEHSLELHRRAEAYRAKHPDVSYQDAVTAVGTH